MKFIIQSLTLSTILVLIVSGCGSTSKYELDQTNGAKEHIKQEDLNASLGDQSKKNTANEDHIRILEQNLVYKENGQEKKDTAFLKYSDNQNYSMYVLPNFELTAEEPYKDVLYLSNNDSIFMRIELLPNDVDWNLIKEETNSQLLAVSKDIRTSASMENASMKDATILEARNEENIVTSYLINNEDIKMKLTIFSNLDEEYRDIFLQMAKTIIKESNKNAG